MKGQWQEFAFFSDPSSAEIVAGLLRSESVPVEVVTDEPVPGLLRGTCLKVPAEMMQRARSIVAQAQFTDEELAFVATGERGHEPNDDSTGS